MFVCMCIFYVCVCECKYVHFNAYRLQVCVRCVRMYVCVYVSVCLNVVCIYECLCVYVYMYIIIIFHVFLHPHTRMC